ncbi:MAG: hypothetical protein HZB15_11160 [Actinobacteria bacterium]|nr:hypothetical protein [Actinomycetota bacterium]
MTTLLETEASGTSHDGVVRAGASSGYVLSSTFGDAGVVSFPSWTEVRRILPLADGSVLVQLERRDTGGYLLATGITKIRSDGMLDPTFAPGGSTPGVVDDGLSLWGALVPMSDGTFFVGSRRFLANGSVDTSYGVDGYVELNGFMVSLSATALVELSGERVVTVNRAAGFDDCYVFVIDASGTLGPLTSTGVLCDEAIPLRQPDGSTLVLVHEIGTGYHLLRLTPDGAVDTSFGMGGVVAVDPAIGITPRLIDAALTTDGGILVLQQGYSNQSSIAKIHSDGSLDHRFNGTGRTTVNGVAQGWTVDGNSNQLIGIGYTFEPPGAPYHPALLHLGDSGQVDTSSNPAGVEPAWLGMTELGINEPASLGPHARRGDHVLVALGLGVTGTSSRVAVIIQLTPTSSPVSSVTTGAEAARSRRT